MRKNRAFTLIELLIVIAIIAILAAIVLVSLSGARSRAQDARIISEMSQIRSAAEIYYSNNNSYSGYGCSVTTPVNIGKICSDIATQAGGTSPVINAGSTEWCSYARLASGGYYCVDEAIATQLTVTLAPTAACGGSNYNCP